MKNLSYILILMILLSSCSSLENNKYKILKSYLNDLNRLKRLEEKSNSCKIKIPDTIYINSLVKKPRNIKRYYFLGNNDLHNAAEFWLDTKAKFILNENDIAYMNAQIEKLVNDKNWNKKKLTCNNFKVLDDTNSKVDLLTKNKVIYNFSEPIINVRNNYSLFYSECILYTIGYQCSRNNFIIMKKINRKWTFIGELGNVQIID